MKILTLTFIIVAALGAQAQEVCTQPSQNALAKQSLGVSINVAVASALTESHEGNTDICYALGNLETAVNLLGFRYADDAYTWPELAGPITELAMRSHRTKGFCSTTRLPDSSGQISPLPFGDRVLLKNELLEMQNLVDVLLTKIGCQPDINK